MMTCSPTTPVDKGLYERLTATKRRHHDDELVSVYMAPMANTPGATICDGPGFEIPPPPPGFMD